MRTSPSHSDIKSRLLANRRLRWVWSVFRQQQQLSEFRKRREHYESVCKERDISYVEEQVISAVRQRMASRGYTPTTRGLGEVHTFAFIPMHSWHPKLLPDLRELGPVTLFDYCSHGFSLSDFHRRDKTAIKQRELMNEMFLQALQKAHKQSPVDWVFIYSNGYAIRRNILQAITKDIGVPIVNMCLDDKQSWVGPWMGDHDAGQLGIAPEFDISWTSSRLACDWYLAEGARPIYMPEGFDLSSTLHINRAKDIPVSFVGEAYGFRPFVIDYLRRFDIDIQAFGRGWPGSAWQDDISDIFRRSRINLGMGGIGYCESWTNVKGRDFDIPALGGGMYLTSYNPDLALHYDIGKEIVCYSTRDELLELLRYYLKHPKESEEISYSARVRCLNEHRWLHRYTKLLHILNVL